MTLDLKAKAEALFWESGVTVSIIEQALKEVQDATRRETIRECADVIQKIWDRGNDYDGWEIAKEEILALLTTPEASETYKLAKEIDDAIEKIYPPEKK